MSERDVRLQSRLADRASRDPAYVGHALDRYCATEGISVQSLSDVLRIDDGALVSLRLCRRPRNDRFADDLNAVSMHVGADATMLATILRQIDAVDHMTGGPAMERGFLLAARERAQAAPDGMNADSNKEVGPRPPREGGE